MALDKVGLKAEIKSILESLADMVEDPASARENFASALSDAIDTFVKSGTVNVTVSTTGTASAQTGTGTGNVS